MAFQVGFTRDSLSFKPAPTGLYDLRVNGFKPKLNKKLDGINFNVELEIVDNGDPDIDGKRIFHPLSTKFNIAIWDFVHSMGLEMEEYTTAEGNTALRMPGIWEHMDEFPEDPSQWGAYMGPMTNAILKADVIESSYMGRPKNEVRAFLCALDGCAEKYPDVKHSTNLISKSK
jgi:hypothetical protein